MLNSINKDYDEDIESIRLFLSNRPQVSGCFCYGIGENIIGNKIYKLILVCDNIWKWQLQNSEECTKYINFLFSSGYDRVEYLGIKENNAIIDYIVIDENSFTKALKTWDNISIAYIFQKPFITVISNNCLDNSIMMNQKNSLLLTTLLYDDNKISFYQLMINLYTIFDNSLADAIALVENDYQYLERMYLKYGYIVNISGYYELNYRKIKNDFNSLPDIIKKHLNIDNIMIKSEKILYQMRHQLLCELSKEKNMRILVNGLFSNFEYNSRKVKSRTLKGKCN